LSAEQPQPRPRRGRRDGEASPEELLTVEEVLALLRVPRSTWYQWRQTGRTPAAIKLPNGQLRIRRSDLTRWLRFLENPPA
jgi:excisionase family DNA binding protein